MYSNVNTKSLTMYVRNYLQAMIVIMGALQLT